MNLREFWRFHFLKVLLILIVLQIGVIAFIQNFNNKPVAVADEASIIEYRELKINPLLNDTDKDVETELSIDTVYNPQHGTAMHKGNIIQYIPANGFIGADSIGYRATDGKKSSDIAYVKISVIENLPPTAMADSITLYNGSILRLSLLHNDTDQEDDSLFITAYSQPDHGQLIEQTNGFYYSVNNPVAKTDSFHYIVSDGKNHSERIPVHITIKSKNHPMYPWLSADIGDAAIKGSAERKGDKFILEGSGSDIWNEEDGFHFLYQYVEGDCEMIAKVESLEGQHEWAKAGIMIRENLSGGSKHSFVLIANRTGASFHQRYNQNESTEGGAITDSIQAPYWVKMIRNDNRFSYFISENGREWQELGNAENPMPAKVYIGIVATSHNNEELATAVYSNLKINANRIKL